MDNITTFRALIDADENSDLRAKAEQAAASVISAAAEQGITLTVEDAYGLRYTRLLALTGEEIGDLQSEIEEGTHAGKKVREERELMEAITDPDGDLKRKADAEAALQKELDALSPAEKMRRARELGHRLPSRLTGEKTAPLTAEEKAAALVEIERLPTAMKLAKVRELGL